MNERKLTKSELAKREDTILKMKKNKRALVQKYGKDAEAVMYGRATKLAKKQAESMDQDRIKEMVKTALMNPVKEDQVEEGNAFVMAADAAKDAGKKEFEFPKGSGKMHPVKIKSDINEWGSSDQTILLKSMHRDLGEPTEFPGLTKIMSAAENATDFYMDDFEEFDTEREGLIMSNARSYALRMFPDFMSMAAKMVEPINTNEAYVDRFSPKAYAEKVAAGTLDIEDAMEETGYPYVDLMKLVKKIKSSASNLKESASTEEKRIAMRAIKSIAKFRGVGTDEAKADLLRAVKELGNLNETKITESKEAGLDELRSIIDQASVLGEEARNIIATYFPSYLAQGEAYGVFNFVESSNPYDNTLVAMVEDIEGDEDSYKGDDEDMMQEDLDLGHQDNEPHMLKGDLYRIGKYAMELYQMVDGFEGQGEVDFPHWWQSKVIKAKDMLVGAKHYLDFEINEPQIDAMVDVASAEDVIDIDIDEGLPKGYWDKKMVAKDEVDESYKTLVNKIKKQGKSEKAAKAIAGAVASYKAKGGGKGPTAKQKG